ncbi:MAG: PorP/SprF family type IX secretion system membrane protein [Cyclobacteriaceae bacterium]
MQRAAVILVICCLTLLPCAGTKAQNYFPLTQQNFLHAANNPAEAGTTGMGIGTALYSRQLNSPLSASSSKLISFNSPVYGRNIGLGLWLSHSSYFVTQRTDAYASYAYHIKNDEFILSMGIQAGFTQYKFNFSDLELLDPDDPAFGADQNTGVLVNTGIGIRLASSRFVVGAVIPRLIKHSLEDQGLSSQYLERRSVNAYGFYVWESSPVLSLIPYLQLGYTQGNSSIHYQAAVVADINQTIQLGGYIKNGGQWAASFGLRINENFRLGYAYDFGKASPSLQQAGSHEVGIRYAFRADQIRDSPILSFY